MFDYLPPPPHSPPPPPPASQIVYVLGLLGGIALARRGRPALVRPLVLGCFWSDCFLQACPTHMRARTHARKHARTRAHARARTHAHTATHKLTYTFIRATPVIQDSPSPSSRPEPAAPDTHHHAHHAHCARYAQLHPIGLLRLRRSSHAQSPLHGTARATTRHLRPARDADRRAPRRPGRAMHAPPCPE